MQEASETDTQSVPSRIIDLLEAEGVSTLIGIPDPVVQHLLREAAARDWHVVAPRHEAAGAMIADGLSRMTGGISVVCGNEGPGVANLLPAVVCAAKEKIPVVFIGGQRFREFDSIVRRSQFQYTHQPEFFRPMVKFAGVVEFADQVDNIFHEAFRLALTGTPGPVYVELPEDHVTAHVSLPPVLPPHRYRQTELGASQHALDAACDLISSSESMIVLAGTGIHTSRTHEAFKALIDTLQCPVIPTWGGRGCLPDTDERVIWYAYEEANRAIAEADLVLAVGTGIGETVHYGTALHWAVGNTDRQWIYLERDPANVGVNRPIDAPVIGDLRQTLNQLTTALASSNFKPDTERTKRLRTAFVEERQSVFKAAPASTPVHPGRMILEATGAIPDDTVIVRDGGCTALWELAYHFLRTNDYLWTSKFGHLGAGLPYAIGAQLAAGPDRRVCLITGDSALQFHISELETAVRKKLPIVIIVNYDAAWGLEHPPAYASFGEEQDTEVRWGDVRFDKIAEAYGAHGEYVERTEDIAPAVKRAFESGRCALVQVAVDPVVNWAEAPQLMEFATWYGNMSYAAES